MHQLAKNLNKWYNKNAKIYPWRENHDPYKIWISEIMLQQTQANTVLNYFKKWIDKYPHLQNLQKANISDLLKLWEGLGYYSRVQNIFKTSQLLNEKYNNLIPKSYEELIKLPGIGDYTASAILSIAFNMPYPSIDGNFKRVLSRLFMIKNSNQVESHFKKIVKKLYFDFEPRIINQAIMDLGREFCTHQNPKCLECPVNNKCRAYISDTVMLYPKKNKRKKIPTYDVVVGIIYKNNKFLIAKRKKTGLLANMWELPGGKKRKNETDLECLNREIKEETTITINKTQYIGNVKHQYSHFKINIKLFKCQQNKGIAKPIESQELQWISKNQINDFTFPSATHKLFKLLNEDNENSI